MADQEKVTLYSQLVKWIVEIEAASARPESGSVDMSGSFSGGRQRPESSYSNLIDLIGEIENRGNIFQRQQRERTQRKEQAQVITPAAPPAEEQVVVSAESLAAANAKMQAEEELSELTKALPVRVPMFEEQKIRKLNSDLVLPNLSLSDQVSELERIIEGFRANIFVGDEKEVVEEELYGLLSKVKREKAELKKRRTLQPDAAQLWSLRDQRLSLAIELLQQMKKR